MAVIYIICAVVILFQFFRPYFADDQPYFRGGVQSGSSVGRVRPVSGCAKLVRFGVARGLFSNEAGMGFHSHAHATAD